MTGLGPSTLDATKPTPAIGAIPSITAAGSADRWRHAVGRAVEHVVTVDDGSDPLMALATETPAICPDPSFGATIDSILTKPAVDVAVANGDDPTADTGDHHGRREGKTPRMNRSTTAGTRGVTPSKPGSLRSTDPSGALCPPGDVRALSARATPELLAAGDKLDRTGRNPPGVKAGRPGQCKSDPALAAVPSDGRTGTTAAAAVPSRTDADDHARRRLARRLGVDDSATLSRALDIAIRSGPTLPARRLARLAGHVGKSPMNQPPRDSVASTPRPGGTPGATHPPTRPGAGDGRSEKHPTDPSHPPSIHPTSGTGGETADRPNRPDRSDHRHGDESSVRHVSDHQEMPQVPDRERATAPVARHSPDAEPQPDALSDRLMSSPVPPVIDRRDLERHMKSILDEAARRHGIET